MVRRADAATTLHVALMLSVGAGASLDPEPSIAGATSQPTASVPSSPCKGVQAQRVTASDVRARSIASAVRGKDVSRSTHLIVDTMSACSNVDQWLPELCLQPSATGLTERTEGGVLDLVAACGSKPTAAECRDAATRTVRF